jgi:hypothetical protein
MTMLKAALDFTRKVATRAREHAAAAGDDMMRMDDKRDDLLSIYRG